MSSVGLETFQVSVCQQGLDFSEHGKGFRSFFFVCFCLCFLWVFFLFFGGGGVFLHMWCFICHSVFVWESIVLGVGSWLEFGMVLRLVGLMNLMLFHFISSD